ncbi:MAG: alanine--tRNA ligase [Candidatus Lokiarchaeota archaeon]|nr:alanine--tRNA ligase [Candidatus Lokiarchaeota archaeon]
MLSDKEQKEVFRKIASADPDKYFPTNELRNKGFIRKLCKCGTYFWTTHEDREVCGSPTCSGGFQVVEDNPSKVKLSFIGVWKKIVEILEPRGYKPINRYPCVARWNPTTEFTIASISAFQPYVITGEIEPPAKKLIIPQFCLRFNDIENVGLTGSHCCGFIMIGQHTFVKPEEWKQGEYFLDMYDFITKGVGVSKHELTIHEDSWAGGGSYGCSLEFFSRGVELFNQVYTMFEQTLEGSRELPLKVLDMGLGQERVAWFSQGTPNMYEATFPYVLSKLREKTNIELDLELYNKFSQYSAYLNIDEVDDMDKAWGRVAQELNMDIVELEKKIMPMAGLYSIAEHARTLLFAINDGKLPSNVGGGYNLRVIFRRAISFIDQFNWDIEIADVCDWHADELRELFPEVSEHLDELRQILNVEKEKYYQTKKNAGKIVKNEIKKGKISEKTLLTLYDSNGINPDIVVEEAKKLGVEVRIPDDFYSRVVALHEKKEQVYATQKELDIDLSNIPETQSLYFDNYEDYSNKAKVLKIIDKYVILDKSVAYPTSGGQLHDIGTISGEKFSNVIKEGKYVIHVMDKPPKFKEGDIVDIIVDKNWRKQIAQHHTTTHIINAATREVLGAHINQAGAKKSQEKAHLDVTHFNAISDEDLKKIEALSNEIVKKNLKTNLSFMPRSEAEKKYGMSIYQGGAVPGKLIRIVEIPDLEVEACGGTHLNRTGEAGEIKILKSQKIQDGIVRITFTAGEATKQLKLTYKNIIQELEDVLHVSTSQIPARVQELIKKWKSTRKSLTSGQINPEDLVLTSTEEKKGDILEEVAKILNSQIELIVERVKKFYSEWEESKQKLEKINNIFADNAIDKYIGEAKQFGELKIITYSFDGINQNDMKNLSIKIFRKASESITVFTSKEKQGIILLGLLGSEASQKSNVNMGKIIKTCVQNFGGKGGGKINYGQGLIPDKTIKETAILEYCIDLIKKS